MLAGRVTVFSFPILNTPLHDLRFLCQIKQLSFSLSSQGTSSFDRSFGIGYDVWNLRSIKMQSHEMVPVYGRCQGQSLRSIPNQLSSGRRQYDNRIYTAWSENIWLQWSLECKTHIIQSTSEKNWNVFLCQYSPAHQHARVLIVKRPVLNLHQNHRFLSHFVLEILMQSQLSCWSFS